MRQWRAYGRYVVSALVSAGIGWMAFVSNRPVPILDWFDLGIHETGHLIAAPLPELVMFMAGSFAQIAFPVAMALYFHIVRSDASASGFCLAWAGTSAWDVSVYVADAPIQALPLIGGRHDWAYILGRFEAIDQAGAIAGWIEGIGAAMVIAGIAVSLISVLRRQWRTAPILPRASALPVREVSDPDAPPGETAETPDPVVTPRDPSPVPWTGPDLLPEDPFSEPVTLRSDGRIS